MSVRFIQRYTTKTATGALDFRSNAAGVCYVDADGKLYYNDNGTVRALLAEGKVNVQAPVSLTATGAVTAAVNAGQSTYLNKSTGLTATLPAATGSGARYRFVVGTALASGSYIIQVASASDYMLGAANGSMDSTGTGNNWQTANSGTVSTETDTITLNGTTQGGRLGDEVVLEDVAANVWAIRTFLNANGTEVTPFSVAV